MKKNVVWCMRKGVIICLTIFLIGQIDIIGQARTQTQVKTKNQVGITFHEKDELKSQESQEVTNPSSNKETQNSFKKKLPQTGEQKSERFELLGILMLGLYGFLLFNRKRNEKNEK